MNSATTTAASAVTAILMAASSPAHADDAGWSIEFTPYLWAAGLDADVAVGNQEVRVEQSFSDLLESLDMAGAFLLRAQRGRWVLWTQLDYLSLSTDKVDDPPEHVTVDTEMLMLTAGIGRNFGSGERRSVDVLLGVRHMSLENTLTFDTLGSFGNDRSFTDPVVIVRPSLKLSDKWRFNPTMSVGAGGDSELTYEMQPQFQYAISDRMALRFGYRKLYYDIDDSSGADAFDGSFQGLFVGLGGTFGTAK